MPPRNRPRLVETESLVETRMPVPRQSRINLVELAYRRIEDLLISCVLRPGQLLTLQEVQNLTGFGRTPVHHAINRLAADTLIIIRPRHGLRIAPIDLARERVLLNLRRDIERFVIRLATERSGPQQRNQLLHMERVLREKRDNISLAEFNVLDHAIDHLILKAAGEPFLEHTLRPLHTIFRRIGFIHHTHLTGATKLDGTVDHHLAVLNAVANGHVARAVAASDALIDFIDGIFDRLEAEIDPSLLDSSIEPILAV